MNENNEYYEEHDLKHRHEHYGCFHERHPWLAHLLTALSVLIGAFLAFYVVTDWHYKRLLDPVHQMKKMERMMMKEDRAMHKMLKRDFRTERNLESYIQLDEAPDSYIVTVNLRPFNNDEENVSISTDNNVLTINASNEKNKKNSSRVLSVSQSYAFPNNVNFDRISKERRGDKYIITVPVKQ